MFKLNNQMEKVEQTGEIAKMPHAAAITISFLTLRPIEEWRMV